MRFHSCLAVVLLTAAGFAQTASVNPSRQPELQNEDEGDVISMSALAHDLPTDKAHPLPRKLIALEEGELSSAPAPQKILVAHYRVELAAQFSMNDDRIVVAVKRGDEFEILKILDSDTAIIDGKLNSERDFEAEFIAINAMHFLRLRTRVSGSGGIVDEEVYTISSDQKLSIIPSQGVSNSKILVEGEELRHGGYRFADGVFTFESSVYEPQDCEACPSEGVYHAEFKLEGEFKEDTNKHAFEPDFRFVVASESRDKGH
jgi:hypothetical protein